MALAEFSFIDRAEVLEFCQRESPYPDSCEFRLVICADGSQNR